ncbi:2-oxoacid:acceptor oxidoreductase family protein [Actinophytocola oryzae]|uniref:Pyruvate ferredoxin oxidoreductase gamma subunit n=1 Tax=Actinophytocola oryzae TaxID=502181 RepID=A0A4R7V1Q0_9PSEU|nr:2-oxoacid:acceptor oxidoreductase family protein [Actinophytocola oryzae]TDV42544.1 pyruvate ferredoxin oxidoreductase gamma subunit [Actinophytocola oryzae]
MIEVRIHGRQGQGVLATAELLAIAASMGGLSAQASPEFTADRVEGEVVASCRLGGAGEHGVDALIVADAGLLDHVLDGLPEDGYLLVNSGQRIDNLGLPPLALRPERAITVPATEIARKLIGQPCLDATLAGGFAALTRAVSLDSVLAAVLQRFPGKAGRTSAAAAVTTFGVVRDELEDLVHPTVRRSSARGRTTA